LAPPLLSALHTRPRLRRLSQPSLILYTVIPSLLPSTVPILSLPPSRLYLFIDTEVVWFPSLRSSSRYQLELGCIASFQLISTPRGKEETAIPLLGAFSFVFPSDRRRCCVRVVSTTLPVLDSSHDLAMVLLKLLLFASRSLPISLRLLAEWHQWVHHLDHLSPRLPHTLSTLPPSKQMRSPLPKQLRNEGQRKRNRVQGAGDGIAMHLAMLRCVRSPFAFRPKSNLFLLSYIDRASSSRSQGDRVRRRGSA
jgi:hypothetical protein